MSDESRKALRGTGQAPSSRDRVGGGMQRSEAQPIDLAPSDGVPWTVYEDCRLCWIHFHNGVIVAGCGCLMDFCEDGVS